MSIVLVTYELKSPGRNYRPVFEYLKTFVHCKGLESVWLLETRVEAQAIRDDIKPLIDANDVVLVVRIYKQWASLACGCGVWLNSSERSW